jgi:thioredoxin-related protein
MWLNNFERARDEAMKSRKPIVLQFEREGCGGCRKLYEFTYKDDKVDRELNEWFIPLRLDIFRDRELRREYSAYWTPSFYFMDYSGKLLYKFNGYLPPIEFRIMLRLALSEYLIPKGKYDEALSALDSDAEALRHGSIFPKLELQKGIVLYLKHRDNNEFRSIMDDIRRKYPGSLESEMYFWEDGI